MTCVNISAGNPALRILGRLDRSQSPLALDWTGSGMEFYFRGANCWVELEAPERAPIFWMIVLADGAPVARFPVEPGVRFYPLMLGMEAEQSRVITLLKETQCMPDHPEATVFLRTLRHDGELLELPELPRKIEFIGDSLTSGEGALAPRDNQEWITPWFSARGNYSWYACNELRAERHILSQSGWGVCWDWQHLPEHNMTDPYEQTVGVLKGPEAEARGCAKPWDFAAWQPDIVCIRLLSNDAGGMNQRNSLEADLPEVTAGCVRLIKKVRACNPGAKIVWILPGTDCHPEIGEAAVNQALQEGLKDVSFFRLPDYEPQDYGARAHPNAEWNRRAGLLLADYLRTLI